jgi:hypothetical protein
MAMGRVASKTRLSDVPGVPGFSRLNGAVHDFITPAGAQVKNRSFSNSRSNADHFGLSATEGSVSYEKVGFRQFRV